MNDKLTLEDLASRARSEYKTVEDMVHHVVREAIVSGVFGPGQRLPQDRIAGSMGVSRIPVRAALRRLEAEGFVRFEVHKGATVRALSPDDVAEIYDLRILLETHALRLASAKITDEELDELERLASEMDTAVEDQGWVEKRKQFYQRLYEIAGSPRTAELIAKLREDVGRYWLRRRVSEHHGGGHTVIVSALRAGDSVQAEQWLQSHLSEVSKQLQRLVREERDSV